MVEPARDGCDARGVLDEEPLCAHHPDALVVVATRARFWLLRCRDCGAALRVWNSRGG